MGDVSRAEANRPMQALDALEGKACVLEVLNRGQRPAQILLGNMASRASEGNIRSFRPVVSNEATRSYEYHFGAFGI